MAAGSDNVLSHEAGRVMTKEFAITYDYLCPFARIANETVVDALQEGAPWTVAFRPFSLHQNHRGSDELAVWDDPEGAEGRGVRALLWSLAVRDGVPDRFADFHVRLFSARHDDGADLGSEAVLGAVAEASGVDAGAISDQVSAGTPMKALAAEHTSLVEDLGVFGVPTFIAGDEAVFVRLMDRHDRASLERVLDMISLTELNEFKRTRIPR